MGHSIRSLRIRPAKSADLSFNMPGIIGAKEAVLGADVPAATFPYDLLERNRTDQEGPIDGAALIEAVEGYRLFGLRNQSAVVALRQALARREVAMYERLVHREEIAKVTAVRVKSLT